MIMSVQLFLFVVDEDYNPNPLDLFSNQEVKLAYIYFH